jgi:plasmid stabilization system protein ParE
MVKRIIWSKSALKSKKEIFDYWNEENGNKKYSIELNNEFNRIIDLLLLFPELGRIVENFEARYLVKHVYIIFYKLNNSSESLTIEILQKWDSRRDPEELTLPYN